MRHQLDDEPPCGKFASLGAVSPVWIYAVNDPQRTRRQRCEGVIKLAEIRVSTSRRPISKETWDIAITTGSCAPLRDTQEWPESVEQTRLDLRRTAIDSATLEFIGVALAKHEVSKRGNRKPIAFAPSLARPDRWCRSMEYEFSNGGAILSYVTRPTSPKPFGSSRGGKPERPGSGQLLGLYEPSRCRAACRMMAS